MFGTRLTRSLQGMSAKAHMQPTFGNMTPFKNMGTMSAPAMKDSFRVSVPSPNHGHSLSC